MNYEDLTKRIEKAKEAKGSEWSMNSHYEHYYGWWDGYICALKDVRNDINTGGEK